MAIGKATHLQRAAVREARLQDQLILEFETELEGVARRLDRAIAQLVRQLAAEDGRLVRTRASLGRALRLRKDLQEALTSSGVTRLIKSAFDERLDELAVSILESQSIAARAASLTSIDVQALTAFKELRLADLLDWSADLSRTAWRITVDGVLGLRPVEELVIDLARALDTSLPKARTIYDTAVSTYSRQVNLLHATGEADELFYYVGPIDRLTRPFCRKLVGKVFTRAEIEAMDNGQIPNVLVSAGGYNCRHAFKRVSILDQELRELHKTGGRLPHIQAQLEELDALEKKSA